jgi:Fe-S cluster biogenesis protein NfuA
MTTEELTTVQKHSKKSDLLNSDGGDISLVSIEEGKHVKDLKALVPAVA